MIPSHFNKSNEQRLIDDLNKFESLRSNEQVKQFFSFNNENMCFFISVFTQLIIAEDVSQAQIHLNSLTQFFSEQNIDFAVTLEDGSASSKIAAKKYKVVKIIAGGILGECHFTHLKFDEQTDISQHHSVFFRLMQFLFSMSIFSYFNLFNEANPEHINSVNQAEKRQETESLEPISATQSTVLFRLLFNGKRIASYSEFKTLCEGLVIQPSKEQLFVDKLESFHYLLHRHLPSESTEPKDINPVLRSLCNSELYHNLPSVAELQQLEDNHQQDLVAQLTQEIADKLELEVQQKQQLLEGQEILALLYGLTSNSDSNSDIEMFDGSSDSSFETDSRSCGSSDESESSHYFTELLAGSPSKTSGLQNFYHTCAFNASLQLLSDIFIANDLDQSAIGELYKNSLYNLLCGLKVTVNRTPSASPLIKLKITLTSTLAKALATKVANKQGYELNVDRGGDCRGTVNVKAECEALNRFVRSLKLVCKQARDKTCRFDDLKTFFERYKKLAIISSNALSKKLLNWSEDNEDYWLPEAIKQVCVNEVMTDLMSITGLSTSSLCSLLQQVTLSAYSTNGCVHTEMHYELPTGIINLATKADSYDISDYLLEHIKEKEASDWELPAELNSSKVSITKKLKQIKFCTQNGSLETPKFLILSLKLFNSNKQKLTSKIKSSFMIGDHSINISLDADVDTGEQSLLKLIEKKFIVNVPISQSSKAQSEAVNMVEYRAIAIICHIGPKINSGHYITIKISDDGKHITICDDSKVMSLADYKKELAKNKKNDVKVDDILATVCLKCKFSGYLYFLKKTVAVQSAEA